MKYRSGKKIVKTLRKYINGKPTNITKTNVSTDPDYIGPYNDLDACPINTPPAAANYTPSAVPTYAYRNSTVTGSNDYTLTFSEYVNGWTSFHSWVPEFMVNMGGDFFSFKSGQLYKHHAKEAERNTFYGTNYPSELEFVTNTAPSERKIFKTIEIEGDTKNWDVTVITDQDKGHISKASFNEQEGVYRTYIRRNSDDIGNTELLSVQGIGMALVVAGNNYTFGEVPSEVSVGDSLYKATSTGGYQLVGTIASVTPGAQNTVLATSASAITPSVNDFMFAAKSPVAESYGLKGYFAKVKISNTSTSKVEVYAVNTEAAKSFP